MKVGPLARAAVVTAALALPLAMVAALLTGRVEALGALLDACVRLRALGGALLGLTILVLAASAVAAGLVQFARQVRIGRRALRCAHACAVGGDAGLAARAEALGVRRLVVCATSERLAFCAGLLWPRVVVSTGLVGSLGPDALEALLAHEATHARRRDPLRQVLAAAGAAALWMVPAAAALAAHGRLRRELNADREAARQTGRRALAKALLAVHDAAPPMSAAAVPGAASQLASRVDALHGAPPPALRLPGRLLAHSFAGAVLPVAVAAAVLVAPPAGGDPLEAVPMSRESMLAMPVACLARAAVLLAFLMALRAMIARARRPAMRGVV
ncbi:M56 family metallopeptidase [Miltoncostaea marina]|uniref:M56 family metallopeptidase n=1 Tax=Miltoncostaea marina TaxID=2843215 RepID=UPI001C3E581F|nr:M56 family metallopeptidase [Miltoncostaea marina]